MAEKHGYDIFLAYSSKDKAWVSEFADALREAGVDAFFDASDLAPGERWQDILQEALRHSKTLLFILSPNSVESPWTFFELGAALADNKRIIPIITEDVDPRELPLILKKFQFLKESSPREAGKQVAKVLEKQTA